MTSFNPDFSNARVPRTLFAIAGRLFTKPSFKTSVLVFIDYQNEYLTGELTLPAAAAAVDQAAKVLAKARAANARIIHVAHKGGKGGSFDRDDVRGAFIPVLTPVDHELVIEKPRPNSFSGTDLAEQLGTKGQHAIFAGFMTHMCVSSTVRAALDLGYGATIVADACATRDLPHHRHGIISHKVLHDAELAALSDRFAQIINTDDID
jgi:nicotinamidase-related amidase